MKSVTGMPLHMRTLLRPIPYPCPWSSIGHPPLTFSNANFISMRLSQLGLSGGSYTLSSGFSKNPSHHLTHGMWHYSYRSAAHGSAPTSSSGPSRALLQSPVLCLCLNVTSSP